MLLDHNIGILSRQVSVGQYGLGSNYRYFRMSRTILNYFFERDKRVYVPFLLLGKNGLYSFRECVCVRELERVYGR